VLHSLVTHCQSCQLDTLPLPPLQRVHTFATAFWTAELLLDESRNMPRTSARPAGSGVHDMVAG